MSLNEFDPSLDWEVMQNPIFDKNGNEVKGHKILTNSQTGGVLQVCKETYTPTTNGQFTEAVDLIQQYTGFELTGYASFKGGSKVMAYLKNTDPKSPLGLKLNEHFVLGNSHDGSTAFFMGITTNIFRCGNMFSQQNMRAKVYHRSDQAQRIKNAVETIDLYYDQQKNLYTHWEDLANTKALPGDPATVIDTLLDIPTQDVNQSISTRKQNIRRDMFNAMTREVQDLGGNMFAVFNGITRYTSNIMQQKNPLYGNPFGRAGDLNKKALKLCSDMAKERPAKTIVNIPAPTPDYFG